MPNRFTIFTIMNIKNIVAGIVLLLYATLLGFLYFKSNTGKGYPNKPIAVIIHSKPGSAIDLMARKVAEISVKYCDEPLVIENRPGTQGIVAMQFVLDKEADGYAILGVTKSFISTVLVNKSTVSMTDFDFVANMISDPEAIITNKVTGIEDINDVLNLSETGGSPQVWIGPGIGSRDHLMAMKTWEKLNINATWRDYKSGPQSVLALMRNEAPIYVGNPADILGKTDLKIIAIASKDRLSALPEVPTFNENGYLIIESMWRGFAFKKGVPDHIVKYMVELLEKISKDEDWLAYCKQVYVVPDFIEQKEFSQKVKDEVDETVVYLTKANLLSSYVKQTILETWLVGIIIMAAIFLLLIFIVKFNLSRLSFDLLLSAFIMGIGLFFFYQTMLFIVPKGMNITSPALIPRLWSVLLVFFSGYNIISILRKKEKAPKIKGNIKPLLLMLLYLLIYFIAIPTIGYFISTPIFIMAGIYTLGYKKIPIIIINAFGFVLFSYLVFQVILKIDLPLGNLL